MRKTAILMLSLLVITCLVLQTGCGKEKTASKTPEGSVEVTEDENGMTIKTEEGETIISGEALSEKDLGIPIYPGAEMVDESVSSYIEKDTEGRVTSLFATLQTQDSVSKVTGWYKEKLAGEPDFLDSTMSSGVDQMGMFSFQSGDLRTTVMVAKDIEGKGVTIIQVNSNKPPEIDQE
ncbi:MAG: hypothetical protein JW738_00090 [Actinobacteria bacterium]|nr:hypothetical protein [Actinomycetota bacterium]